MYHEQKFKITGVIKIVLLALALGLGVNYALATWNYPGYPGAPISPTACPQNTPGCDQPVNVSNTGQSKIGSLALDPGGLFVRGSIRASSSIAFDGELMPYGMAPCPDTSDQTIYRNSSLDRWVCTGFAPSYWVATSTTYTGAAAVANSMANIPIGDVFINRNFWLPNTTSGLTQGVIKFGDANFIHNKGSAPGTLPNVFVGHSAGGGSGNGGGRNTGVGAFALAADGMIGFDNIGIGYASLSSLTSGANNIAIGSSAGGNLGAGGITSSNNNIAIGKQSLYLGNGSNSNVLVGNGTMSAVTTGSANVAMGDSALAATTNSSSTAIGYHALMSSLGSGNVGVGYLAMAANTNGNRNTGVGYQVMSVGDGNGSTTFVDNTAVGWNTMASTTLGSYNVSLGVSALRYNTTGNYNTALGYQTLFNNVDKGQNTAVGYQALFNNDINQASFTAENNTAVGHKALFSNSNGQRNTAVGGLALQKNSLGNDNVAVGYQTLTGAIAGVGVEVSGNVAVGVGALQNLNNSSANNNTAIGFGALDSVTSGSSNVALGMNAGSSAGVVTTGSNNTFLGTGASFLSSTQRTGATAIGSGSKVDCDNCLVLGDTSVKVGIATSSPGDALQIGAAGGTRHYLRLDSTTVAPPAGECTTALVGRMIFESTTNRLYICGGAGTWVTK